VGERAWQVTHLGGHRFAPNVLVLPQRAHYGRVTPEALPAFLETVEAGRLAFPLLRGRTGLPRAAQAAEVFAGIDDLELASVAGDDDQAQVAFSSPSGPVLISVARDETPLWVVPSCGAEPEAVRPYYCPRT
jgi:(2Fe-2S) ferredoxin